MVAGSYRESEVGAKKKGHTFVCSDNADAVSLMRGPEMSKGTFDPFRVTAQAVSVYVYALWRVCIFLNLRGFD